MPVRLSNRGGGRASLECPSADFRCRAVQRGAFRVKERLRQVGMGWVLVSSLVGWQAHAQSASLLEAVRLHRPGATAQACQELAACTARRWATLSLIHI